MVKIGKYIVLGDVDMLTIGEVIRGQKEEEESAEVAEAKRKASIWFGTDIVNNLTHQEVIQLSLCSEW